MEMYQLRAYVTAATLGSVTRTAEALHVTQPAVTAQIKALEEELGVALFDRRPGRISLTRAGESLLADAQKVLDAAGHLQGRAKDLQGEITGQLVIGTSTDPDSLRLGSLLRALVSALPLLEIKTRYGLAQDLCEQVMSGSMQGAFYIAANMPRDLEVLVLQTRHYRIVAPAALRNEVLKAGWRDLSQLPWIATPAQHHTQHLLMALFARQGLAPHQILEADTMAAGESLVRAGLGLTLLREDKAIDLAGKDELVIWPHARVPAQLGFIYGRSTEHDPALVATLSQLRRVWGLSESV
ncbi:LysR family transcriptional regulator [Diaphorobacter sp. HDW4B]|uniref:LysR family transcriptional regulator n=1 Tax=Diaphorobacter sp. HDW4B TaxID=2714925 RepID=UPI001409B649|nr:LysR family transcriptional regulator [Diaphorobacter sp. HDW4B]QIL68975.1 LysR family transcriptional regulator [Diaphorobacter sp. HDW4B]